MAMQGHGVDRHLCGLRRAARELGQPVHPLFADKGFTESTHFRLSTSSISMKHCSTPTFGPVCADGYGVCYNIRDHEILAGVTCYKDAMRTAPRFAGAIAAALTSLHGVLGVLPPPAKL